MGSVEISEPSRWAPLRSEPSRWAPLRIEPSRWAPKGNSAPSSRAPLRNGASSPSARFSSKLIGLPLRSLHWLITRSMSFPRSGSSAVGGGDGGGDRVSGEGGGGAHTFDKTHHMKVMMRSPARGGSTRCGHSISMITAPSEAAPPISRRAALPHVPSAPSLQSPREAVMDSVSEIFLMTLRGLFAHSKNRSMCQAATEAWWHTSQIHTSPRLGGFFQMQRVNTERVKHNVQTLGGGSSQEKITRTGHRGTQTNKPRHNSFGPFGHTTFGSGGEGADLSKPRRLQWRHAPPSPCASSVA